MTGRSSTGSALLALLLLSGCSGGGSYPDRPILLVCPWAAGGGSDRVARQIGALLEQELKVQVNVVNKTGGEGVTGHSEGARAAADGYTLTLLTVEINMLHWRGLTRMTWKDFEPVMLLNRDPAAILVRTEAPWATLKDLEAEVRRGGRPLRAAGTAAGAIWHLALGGWLDRIGLPPSAIPWVSIPGAAPSLQELIAGGVDLVCCSLPEARTLITSGKVRPLGVMSPRRLDAFPDVPTFREQGVDWSMDGWRGIGVPRGTPRKVVDVLVGALEKVAADPRYLQAMATAGHGATAEGPSAFAGTLREFDARLGAFLTRPEFRTMTAGPVGPMAFPGGLALVLAGALAVLGLTGGLKSDGSAWQTSRLLEGVAWVLLWMALLAPLGFAATSSILLFGLMLRLGVRAVPAFTASFVLVGAVYVFFGHVLRVPLPRGLLAF
ncbi:MAG TPA: tripartite tricarboxylate transporter substrate-binding protein [Planctomycetota bacterium]|nr:tripartite tricarboxylate transporter substrate-binding protein [Planctomycetota bacterium]